jgi:ketosteroid isomerase-like protein
MDIDAAERHAEGWLAAWNAHDLDGVLALFADEVVFTSPLAADLLGISDGTVQGKDALRSYWEVGLSKNPDLHFERVDVLAGVDTLTVLYRNQRGRLVTEMLRIRGDGLVDRGWVSYGAVP